MDVLIINWSTTGSYYRKWNESGSSANTTVHIVGDLQASRGYEVWVDSILGANISGSNCSDGVCISNSSGNIAFNYTGGYSTKTFEMSLCTESWSCSAWSECSGGIQTRTCSDANACGTTVDRPGLSQSCSSGGSPGGDGGGGPSCTSNQTRNCSLSYKGECALGMETCVNGSWTGCPLPSPEVCNRMDDDCDGSADENLTCECYSGESRQCGSDIGECRKGSQHCNQGTWELECVGEIKPAEGCVETETNVTTNITNNMEICQDGAIPAAGCRCGDAEYKAGYCYSGQYYENSGTGGNEKAPLFPVLITAIIIALSVAIAIIFRKLHKKAKDASWDELVRKYRSSARKK